MSKRVKAIALRQEIESRSYLIRLTLFALVIGILFLSTGCSQLDYRRIAYETLRQVDCHVNELDQFCDRSFANEYHEYERLREDYLNNRTVHETLLSTHHAHDKKS
ncbi:MAG: hypothetical protein KTR35_17685 [Gammaproteobacteria bacterium]|nr:hypothetical protein [Gammaproteobacteria bacterium]